MKEWSHEEAVLTVDIGAGWISRYEFEGLSEGCVIRSLAEAGTLAVARLNGDFFARVSVNILDISGSSSQARFGATLESLDAVENVILQPVRGDEATELLPFAIRIGSVTVPMGTLEGAGVFSLVNLDRKVDGEADADLILSGITVATGKVVVIGENLGIRITQILCKPPQGNFPRTTGSVLAPLYDSEPVKNFNFRMPDCFTKKAIMRTQDIHLNFLRGYQSRFPESGTWQLTCVDQLNYGEWLDDGACAKSTFLSFRPAERVREYQRDKTFCLPKTFLIEAVNASIPLDGPCIEGMREWARRRVEKVSVLPFQIAFDTTSAVLLQKDPLFEVGLACLRNSWLGAADLRIGLSAGADPAVVSKLPVPCDEAGRWNMILVATFTSDCGGTIDIVYSESLLEPFLPALGR